MDDGRETDQARAMIHRVSPQGRAEARRLRAARARRTRRLAVRWLVATALVFAGYAALNAAAGPFGPTGFMLAVAATLVACAILAALGRERPMAGPAVAPGELPLLPARAEAWIAAQRPSLPAPAATLLGAIGARVAALAPHLSRLDEQEPAADELRRLVGGELPGLVDQYRAVPAGLRAEPRADGATPDARLLHALGTVDRQLTDLTRRIGAGAADGLSTRDRYLESKYGTGPGDAPLGG